MSLESFGYFFEKFLRCFEIFRSYDCIKIIESLRSSAKANYLYKKNHILINSH